MTVPAPAQLLLVFPTWIGVLLHPPTKSTWIGVNLQSSALWLALSWGEILLAQLGLGVRSGHVRFTDETTAHEAVIYSAVAVSVFGLLATLFLSSLFAFD